jgi:imidazoleglycerol-phosphate dehydratase
MTRAAEQSRKTKETEIRVSVDLDGGAAEIATGVGFLDHMLELLARHGHLGLRVEASGDLETGAHHTVEDVGIVLGQAVDVALGDRSGIRRYGAALVPMDESLAECAIDISGRPLCVYEAELPATSIAGFDTDLAEEFFRAFAASAKATLHLSVRRGTNPHHMIEACFKAFARALREAVEIDPSETGVPSTKGSLGG